MLTEADRKELKLREKNLIDLVKKLKAALENQRKQQNNQKCRIESLDDETRISVISKIAISGSAAHEKRTNKVIRTSGGLAPGARVPWHP